MKATFSLLGAVGCLALAMSCNSAVSPAARAQSADAAAVARAHGCPALTGGKVVGAAGQRKLALIVGVGDYLFEVGGRPIDLVGPPGDAQKIYDLLVNNYGFPKENICVLLDKDANTANVDKAWQKALVERAAPGDTAVFFFAGHGSQVSDWDEPGVDEQDGLDETMMLHDSRSQGGTLPYDLVDDKFNGMVAQLYKKTENTIILIDACNSGSATRDVSDQVVKRQAVKLELPKPAGYNKEAGVFGDYQPASMPKLVFFSAARDGTSALEKSGEGVFTKALILALAEGNGPMSWGQLTRAIPRYIAAQNSFQVPTFDGDLSRMVFDSKTITRPLSWNVARVAGGQITLQGPALPGWTPGAIVAIYAGNSSTDDIRSGKAALKGKVRIDEATPFEAKGSALGDGSAIKDSDIAVLEQAGKDAVAIKVKIDAKVNNAAAITAAIAKSEAFAATVQVVPSGHDFLVDVDSKGQLTVWGAEGTLRNTVTGTPEEQVSKLVFNLGLHARQRALSNLKGNAGGAYTNNQTLAVKISTEGEQWGCPQGQFSPAAPNAAAQSVPLCTRIQLEVELTETPAEPLYIGVLYLSNDGSIASWPKGNEKIEFVKKGDRYVKKLGMAAPPLNAMDQVLVFGTPSRVEWNLMSVEAARSVGGAKDLNAMILGTVGGTRGLDVEEEEPVLGAWTVSSLSVRNTADDGAWTEADRSNPEVCSLRKTQYEASGKVCPK